MQSTIVVDDHPVVRCAVKYWLDASGLAFQVDEAGDAQDAMKLFRSKDYVLALLDIDLPDQDGLELLRRAKRLQTQCAFLILSHHSPEAFELRCLRAGAMGYLSKAIEGADFARAVRQILRGRRLVSTQLAERLVTEDGMFSEQRDPHQNLSSRELQIFRMLAAGRGTSQIAEVLSLSVKTVHTHRARAMQKTGLRNNAEIARYAVNKGLVT